MSTVESEVAAYKAAAHGEVIEMSPEAVKVLPEEADSEARKAGLEINRPSPMRKFLSRAFEVCLALAVALYVCKDFFNALYFYYLVNYK